MERNWWMPNDLGNTREESLVGEIRSVSYIKEVPEKEIERTREIACVTPSFCWMRHVYS